MTKKPIIFNVNAILFLLIALSVPVQLLFGLDIGMNNLKDIFMRLNVLNVSIIVTFLTAAAMFYNVSRHLIWFLPTCSLKL